MPSRTPGEGKYTIDLFAGAGGSEGFIQTGFNPIAHVEMNFCLNTGHKKFVLLSKALQLDIYYQYCGEITRRVFAEDS